jgi:uncharacterized repeat protein (TIGR04138 family)
MVTPEILITIRKDILDSGRDNRYNLAAYAFVLNGLEFYRTKTGEKRHFTGQELCGGLMEFACRQFGPMTTTVLEHWGVRSTDDFGYIVYNLIDIRLIRKQPSDSLQDFFGVLDIHEFTERSDYFQVDRDHVKTVRGA